MTNPETSRGRHLLGIPSRKNLKRVLSYVLDENEFLSPYGIRSISKVITAQLVKWRVRTRPPHLPGSKRRLFVGWKVGFLWDKIKGVKGGCLSGKWYDICRVSIGIPGTKRVCSNRNHPFVLYFSSIFLLSYYSIMKIIHLSLTSKKRSTEWSMYRGSPILICLVVTATGEDQFGSVVSYRSKQGSNSNWLYIII